MRKLPPLYYLNCDKDTKNSKLFTIDELIEDVLYGANLSDDEDVIPPFFKDSMDCIEKLRTYFRQNNSEKTFNELNSIHNDELNTQRQSARQMAVKDFLN
ncbi:hypothetical protein AVEN_41738-1 [Araneus ventricosus]|uniref:Uncharacterized protein n=1 Tax=Araneus ventricosus TaxID=182803 RepID=A0A4Y2ABQ9_ARAVE|nr:hypothetical protein AVEN_41738-1 [Araneus ventricosus]